MRADAGITDVKGLIRSLPGLDAINDPAWSNAVDAATVVRIPDNSSLNVCSNDVDYVTVVLSGALKVRARSDDGRIFSMYRVRPGEICMLSMAFMYSHERLFADVGTEGDVLLLRIPGPHFERLLVQSPGFRTHLLTSMSGYVVKLLHLVEEVTFERLQTRIVMHLEDVLKASGSNTIRVTHQELAHELGSTREVVSRLLKSMEKAGTIDLGRGTITLRKESTP